jgi:hypothetical protein
VLGALHHALLTLASLALLAAGHRLAAQLSNHPLERIVTAFVLAAATAVIEALALGLLSLGSDPIGLTGAAVATHLVSVAVTRAPDPPTRVLLGREWAALPQNRRAMTGAVAGVALLVVAWPLRFPAIGFDGTVYHLPEIAGWVATGRPGAITSVSYLFPFANYPITNEVALTWATGISRSLVPVVVWSQIMVVMTALAATLGLAAVGVPRVPRFLAAGAVLTTPVLLTQFGTPSTDIAGLGWLVCAAALAAAARHRPGLAPAALVAAGLAIGSKTTTAPLAVGIIVVVGWGARPWAGRQGWALAAGACACLVVGATWSVRNAVTHGWPLWPFASGPGGDPVPRVWRLIEPSLASRPRATVESRVSGYVGLFGGALLLFGAGALAWLARPRRRIALASLATVIAVGLWAVAPSTGQPDTPVFQSNPLATTRYALPAVAAAGAAVALVASTTTRLGWTARALLAAALGWSLLEDLHLSQPSVPALWAVAVAGLGGALLATAAPTRFSLSAKLVGPRVIGLALVGGALLSVPAEGLIRRQADILPGVPGTPAVAWARSQPGYGTPQQISFAGTVIGQFAGERLGHRLLLLPAESRCSEVRARAARSLVVVADAPVFDQLGVRTPAHCLDGLPTAYEDAGTRIFGRLATPTAHGPR